jgi:lysozyme
VIDDRLKKTLRRHEGARHLPYFDTEGKLTIGVGHNLDDRQISARAIDLILEDDITDAIGDLDRFSWFHEQNMVRKQALIMMCFNLGINRLLGFKRMIAAIKRGDYSAAADEMLDSKWAAQVHGRANELARIMRDGEWHE